MVKSDYVFESGQAIDVGSHKETNFLFHSGKPVPNTGLSTLVFESGTGLGAKTFRYSINGGPLKTMLTVETAEDHVPYYNSQLSEGSSPSHGDADHNYLAPTWTEGTVHAHRDTSEDELALIWTWGKTKDTGEYGAEISVDLSNDSFDTSKRVVWDGDTDDEFKSNEVNNGWNEHNTDGWGILSTGFDDVTFSLGSYDHSQVGDNEPVREVDGWYVYNNDGTRESIDSDGQSGTLRVVAP